MIIYHRGVLNNELLYDMIIQKGSEMMAKISVRKEIVKILCDKKIFPVGTKLSAWEYACIIRKHLPREVVDLVKNFENSTREVLNAIAGCRRYYSPSIDSLTLKIEKHPKNLHNLVTYEIC